MGVTVSKPRTRPPGNQGTAVAKEPPKEPDRLPPPDTYSKPVTPRDAGVEDVAAGGEHNSRGASASSNGRHIPPPFPPLLRKADVFQLSDYKSVDSRAIQAPTRLLLGSFRELVDYLTAGAQTDMGRLRALFRWITSVDVFNIRMDEIPPPQSPLDYFLRIKNNNGNHAHLFSGMCHMASIPCIIVSGMNKSAAYEVGKKADRKQMGAQWNAVFVDGEWRLVDTFWACACIVGKKSGDWRLVDADGQIADCKESDDSEEEDEGYTQFRINEFYFIPDPDQLIWTHFPDDNKWQLLQQPKSRDEFQSHVYIRERFHRLDMQMSSKSERKCVVCTRNGEIDLEFNLPVDRSDTYKFKYILYRSKQQVDPSKKGFVLERFVFYEQRKNLVYLSLRFPIKGMYKLDLFGADSKEDGVFDLVCTYLIQCSEPKESCMPLPDVPPLGWGPVSATVDAGLKPMTHQTGLVRTEDGNVEIRFAMDKDLNIHQSLLHAAIDQATLSNYSVTRLENGEAVISIRLPQGGEYALKLYANGDGQGGEAPNVCNYLIKCDSDDVHSIPFPNIPSGYLGANYMSEQLGVKAVSHPIGFIDAKDGKVSLTFEANNNVELLTEIHKSTGNETSGMFVKQSTENNQCRLDVNMAQKGEYSLNIFAKDKQNPSRIYNVHTYLLSSGGYVTNDEDITTPRIIQVVPTETVETADSELWIPVPESCEHVMAALHRKNANDPPTCNEIELLTQTDGQEMICVKLPEFGDYMLNLYDHTSDGGVVNVAKYQINRKAMSEIYQSNLKTIMESVEIETRDDASSEFSDTDILPSSRSPRADEEKEKKREPWKDHKKEEKPEEKRKRIALKKLKKAVELKDSGSLERALAACQEAEVESADTMEEARKLLSLLHAKDALTDATMKRDMKLLESAISHAKNVNFRHHLDLQIALAQKLLVQIQRIEKLRHDVMSMEQKTIAELKTYTNPPPGIVPVMQATFLMLGCDKSQIKDWRSLQVLISKTGRESVMRKISYFDPERTYQEVAAYAKEILQPYSLAQIRDASAGAATFFIWASGMIEAVETTGGAGHLPPKETSKLKRKAKQVIMQTKFS